MAVLLVAAVYLVAVQTRHGQLLDERAVLGRFATRAAHRDVDRLLSSITAASVVLLGGGLMLVALVRGQRRIALASVAVIGLSVGSTELLKHVLLPRPVLAVAPILHSPTFPSGHSAVGMSLALAAVMVAPPAMRTLTAALGLLFALAIGVGVLSAGWHRPSDVLGAYLVTFAWAALVCAFLVRRTPGAGRAEVGPRREQPLVSPMLLGSGLTLLGVGILVAAGVVLEQRRTGFERIGLGWNYAAACAAILGLGTVLVALFLWLLRGVSLDEPARRL